MFFLLICKRPSFLRSNNLGTRISGTHSTGYDIIFYSERCCFTILLVYHTSHGGRPYAFTINEYITYGWRVFEVSTCSITSKNPLNECLRKFRSRFNKKISNFYPSLLYELLWRT